MFKKQIVKLGACVLSGAILFSIAACGGTVTESSLTTNSSESTASSEIMSSTQPSIAVGADGWYSLVEKTVDGADITSTFIANAIKLENGTAYVHSADATGLTTQQGTYTVEGSLVNVLIGVKTYDYEVNTEEGTMTYSGKINKQQVTMVYRYDENFALSNSDKGVAFTDQLFGESLEENFYNYCPTALMEGNNVMHIWYCSNKDSGNVTDYVAYRKGVLNDAGKWEFSEKKLVLSPTKGTWDERHTCDPSVVKGSFKMKGENYSYLMAYLGCTTSDGTQNEVGIAVAKKPEGPWVKVDSLNPIANFYTSADHNAKSWGYGQPSLINVDKGGKVFLIYTKGVVSGTYAYVEEWDLSDIDHAKKLRETRMSDAGVVNASGQTDVINNADFAYDPHLQRLYCIKEDFGYPTDGGVNWITGSNTLLYIDLGSKGLETVFDEYRWNVGGKVTSAATGFHRSHNMGILTDEYGCLANPYQIPIIYTRSDAATDYPDWNKGGQWPALHTYRLYGYLLTTK